MKKLSSLRMMLADKGLTLAGGDKPTSHDYNALLEQVRDLDECDVIRTLLLRSQSQAEYSPKNMGHFGLAYDAYAHFTSPIRRYPDLLVHRAIRAKLRAKNRQATQSAHETKAYSSIDRCCEQLPLRCKSNRATERALFASISSGR